MDYKSRGLRRRGDTDKWEVALSHKDPMSGEVVTSYHTVEATSRKKAEKKRDELIQQLESKGSAYTSQTTLKEFLDEFIQHKEEGGLVERSTIDHYRKHAKVVCRYLGGHRLAEVSIPAVNGWMAQMVSEGYAPRSVSKCFGLLKQAMKYAVMLDLVTKNPCEFCRPPKISRKKLNVLDRDERTRMLKLATAAEPSPLAVAMTLNTYAEVDPEAKRAAVDKIGDAFDVDLDSVFAEKLEAPAFTMSFTVEQLRAMLAEAERREADDAYA